MWDTFLYEEIQLTLQDESKCVSKERADGVYEETFLKFIGILYRTPVSVQTFAELSRMCELCEELIAIEAVNIELQAAILNWDSDRWREEILSDLPKALELAYRLKSKLLYREIYTHTAGWAARDLSTSHSKILEVLPKEVAMPVLKDALKINTAVKRLYHACFKMYFEFRPSVNTCDPLDTIYNRVLGKIPENPENETAESLAKFFEAIRNLPKEMFTHRNLKADTELRRVFIRNGIASLPLYMETALLEAAFLLKNRLRFTEAYSPKDLNYLTCAYVEESELPWLKGESSMDEFWSEAVSSLLSLL